MVEAFAPLETAQKAALTFLWLRKVEEKPEFLRRLPKDLYVFIARMMVTEAQPTEAQPTEAQPPTDI